MWVNLSRTRTTFSYKFSQLFSKKYILGDPGADSGLGGRELFFSPFFPDRLDFPSPPLSAPWFPKMLKIDNPESFIVLFFTTKVSTLVFVEGGEALSQSLKDKILKNLITYFRH